MDPPSETAQLSLVSQPLDTLTHAPCSWVVVTECLCSGLKVTRGGRELFLQSR